MQNMSRSAWEKWRFLLSLRWMGLFGLCCLFAAICVSLSLWQFDRHHNAMAALEKINRNYDAPILPFADNNQIFNAFDPETQWRRISITGTYQITDQRIVRNRPLNGRPGYEQLIPFRTTSGQTIIIDRGWLPIGDGPGRPDQIADPAGGQITVIVRIKPSEDRLNRTAPEGQLANVDLSRYAEQLMYPIAGGAYGLLASENPPARSMPLLLPRPNIGQGPHLSYAIQWLIFATLGFIGFCFGACQAKNSKTAVADSGNDSSRPGDQGMNRRLSDEQAEDALLDANRYPGSAP